MRELHDPQQGSGGTGADAAKASQAVGFDNHAVVVGRNVIKTRRVLQHKHLNFRPVKIVSCSLLILGPNGHARDILLLQVVVNEKLLILIVGILCRRKAYAACWREQAATLKDGSEGQSRCTVTRPGNQVIREILAPTQGRACQFARTKKASQNTQWLHPQR